jgi:hypothetical protein
MNELRISVIQNHDDPAKDKRVDIQITDVDAVLGGIKGTPSNPLAPGAGELLDLVKTVLAKCEDTDKVEIGRDEEGKINPAAAFVHQAVSGKKVSFSL